MTIVGQISSGPTKTQAKICPHKAGIFIAITINIVAEDGSSIKTKPKWLYLAFFFAFFFAFAAIATED